MTMGTGAALMEELAIDKRRGFFVNHDLAGYEVPVHADIPHQEVIFLDETDPISSPMKAKGVGELGICGVAAAIANAVHNATGVRVRNYPITLDKLLDRLPDVDERDLRDCQAVNSMLDAGTRAGGGMITRIRCSQHVDGEDGGPEPCRDRDQGAAAPSILLVVVPTDGCAIAIRSTARIDRGGISQLRKEEEI